MSTYDEWTLCKNCIYFEDCDTKEDRFGCYCGEPKFPRGKRAEIGVYDDANSTFDMEYVINKFHKDQDGIAVIDDFKIASVSITKENEI